jgi:2-amino-4-hydroxy-6-hydroxymethyldihydropteridine diphosphokinase
MSEVLIGCGSNISPRRETLQEANRLLESSEDVTSLVKSPLFETAPLGGPVGQFSYLNGCAKLETSLSPHEVLALLQSIETKLGRTRQERWGSRTIDLDILLYDNLTIDEPDLTLPHPRMAWRRFVLEPASRIAPDWTHPRFQVTIQELLDHLRNTPPVFSVIGGSGKERRNLIERLEQETTSLRNSTKRPLIFQDGESECCKRMPKCTIVLVDNDTLTHPDEDTFIPKHVPYILVFLESSPKEISRELTAIVEGMACGPDEHLQEKAW